jgi:hypothetical protein
MAEVYMAFLGLCERKTMLAYRALGSCVAEKTIWDLAIYEWRGLRDTLREIGRIRNKWMRT